MRGPPLAELPRLLPLILGAALGGWLGGLGHPTWGAPCGGVYGGLLGSAAVWLWQRPQALPLRLLATFLLLAVGLGLLWIAIGYAAAVTGLAGAAR